MRTAILTVLFIAMAAGGAAAGKLDSLNVLLAGGGSGPDPVPTVAESGADYFALKLPKTSAVLAEDFPVDHEQVVSAIDAAGTAETERVTALSDTLTRVAISYELKLLDAPEDLLEVIIDRQADYVQELLDGEGADVCAPVIFDGSRDLIGRGLWDKYAPAIDETMAVYFDAVDQAIASPSGIGDMTADDGAAVVAQMTAQGDKALMDHFGVMSRESPENCPAVLAIIEAVKALSGDARRRMVAAQARGASRL